MTRRDRGKAAEERVAQHLREAGFELLARNLYVGRTEIDIVARRGVLLVFCEVRSRRSDDYGHPALSLSRDKRRRLRIAAARWLRSHPAPFAHIRFDIATLTGDLQDESSLAAARLEYFPNAF